eukprot:TRINITY_DN23764_c0_g1_i4.p1 TRINITY_DN23764_c0_g1~~TRINITY_DN23764_c0_g1_i4.p1  ORF type:complete len:125 (+),score=14.79 TRINITY_DN23764_c0_g1_i4:74-448(+)
MHVVKDYFKKCPDILVKIIVHHISNSTYYKDFTAEDTVELTTLVQDYPLYLSTERGIRIIENKFNYRAEIVADEFIGKSTILYISEVLLPFEIDMLSEEEYCEDEEFFDELWQPWMCEYWLISC